MTVEELDLAPMVDVAFQLVLFFMVTATTVLYKTLEIPKPTADQPPGAVAQGHSRSVEDLQKDYILVEIDAGGAMKIDREPVAANVDALAERLRTAREKTNRKVMLLSADYATPHRNAVLAIDAANEIGMSIAMAKPTAPQGPAPSVFPGAGRGGATRPGGQRAPRRHRRPHPRRPRPPPAHRPRPRRPPRRGPPRHRAAFHSESGPVTDKTVPSAARPLRSPTHIHMRETCRVGRGGPSSNRRAHPARTGCR